MLNGRQNLAFHQNYCFLQTTQFYLTFPKITIMKAFNYNFCQLLQSFAKNVSICLDQILLSILIHVHMLQNKIYSQLPEYFCPLVTYKFQMHLFNDIHFPLFPRIL
jgi:hypothetical protein